MILLNSDIQRLEYKAMYARFVRCLPALRTVDEIGVDSKPWQVKSWK